MNKFYKKLLSLNLLKRAWHLARHNTRSDFIHDPYKYNDYAYKLIDDIEAVKSRQEESRKKLDELFNSLMQRAFAGDLVV